MLHWLGVATSRNCVHKMAGCVFASLCFLVMFLRVCLSEPGHRCYIALLALLIKAEGGGMLKISRTNISLAPILSFCIFNIPCPCFVCPSVWYVTHLCGSKTHTFRTFVFYECVCWHVSLQMCRIPPVVWPLHHFPLHTDTRCSPSVHSLVSVWSFFKNCNTSAVKFRLGVWQNR